MTDTEDRQMTEEIDTDTEAAASDTTDTTSRRTWVWVLLVVAAVVVAGAIVWIATSGNGGDTDPVETLNTATVERTDVVAMEVLAGTLGYGTAEAVVYQSSTDGVLTLEGIKQGFVTDIVDAGTVMESGMVLYDVNTEPVVVLDGDLPAYRTFTSGMSDGPDVEQLEQALVDLGFDPDGDITIDEDFTTATADAIERLQESIGAEETGHCRGLSSLWLRGFGVVRCRNGRGAGQVPARCGPPQRRRLRLAGGRRRRLAGAAL